MLNLFYAILISKLVSMLKIVDPIIQHACGDLATEKVCAVFRFIGLSNMGEFVVHFKIKWMIFDHVCS